MTEINTILDGFNIGFNIKRERIYKVKLGQKMYTQNEKQTKRE